MLAMLLMLASVILTFSSTAYAAKKNVTVTFDGNGGTVSVKTKTVTVGETYGSLSSASRQGYTFDGWYTAKSGGTHITAKTKVTNNKNHTLYAHWTANTYTVTFNGDGVKVSPESKKVKFNSTYGTLPSPQKYGYTFEGWYTARNGKGTKITANSTVSTASNHTLFAKWKPIKRKLIFDANGGTVSPTSKEVTYDEKLGDLPTPKKKGFTFAGWSTKKTGDPKYVNSNTKFKQDTNLTVYARWNVTVSFVTNGGSKVADRKYVIDKQYDKLPAPTKSGYRFLGWYRGTTGNSRIYESDKASTEVKTMYARWEPINGAFVLRDCWVYDGGAAIRYSKADHIKFTADQSTLNGLRKEVKGMSESKQKTAAWFALDAVGSYYCQEQRNTDGAFDCSSLVGRAYKYAGVSELFDGLPSTYTMVE